MSVIPTTSGHIVTMSDGSAFVTSPNVANDVISIMSTIMNAMANDLSKLTGLSSEDILRDYYEECECDLMTAAYNAVIRRHGSEPLPTLTRTVINSKLEEREKK